MGADRIRAARNDVTREMESTIPAHSLFDGHRACREIGASRWLASFFQDLGMISDVSIEGCVGERRNQ
jgi:hypothetical protein